MRAESEHQAERGRAVPAHLVGGCVLKPRRSSQAYLSERSCTPPKA